MLNLVLRLHDDGPEQLIDPYIVDDVDRRSFHIFIEIAYKCISLDIKERPTMDEIVKTIEEALDIQNQQAVSRIAKRRNPAESLEKFQIPLDEIRKATKNFNDETLIDFRSELEMVSILHHENIAPFIGYCDEICAIVSEYAINGSLYSQLEDPNKCITWTQRLKICIGVAKGLRHLHSRLGECWIVNSDSAKSNIPKSNQQAVSRIAKRRNPAESLEKFQIPLDEIRKATKNFNDETLIE
nr:protein kinase, ATP binding site-containing protein [Tanacetum cinerariifolium]